MNAKRTVPMLLVLTSLLGLLASACCYDPYYYHHRRHYRGGYDRSSLDLKVDTTPAAQAGVAAR